MSVLPYQCLHSFYQLVTVFNKNIYIYTMCSYVYVYAYIALTYFRKHTQVLGSHQNVLTTRLNEGLALSDHSTKILSLDDFPTGIMYHHNRDYMKRLKNKEVDPYGFHMYVPSFWVLLFYRCHKPSSSCLTNFVAPYLITPPPPPPIRCWTQGKPQKLVYLRKASMWYLTEQCSPLESLQADTRDRKRQRFGGTPEPGPIYEHVQHLVQSIGENQMDAVWRKFSSRCCMRMEGAP